MNFPTKPGKQKRQGRDDNEQSKMFIAKAREIEADETRTASDRLLGRLAKMKPKPRTKAK